MAVTFVAVFFWLTSRQYATFDVRAPDLERFNQGVWNTLHGRFLYSAMKAGSLLGNHFSPMMALLSPLLLEKVEVAVADPNDFYEPAGETPVAVRPGQTLRAMLYWRALDRPEGECTVSVRIMSDEGDLLAQHDMLPSNGARPTSWWEPGW
jgi:hypothetical protein